eukprot:Ihof_evm5s274 gene=Ihof_evmTU5s274
MLTITGTVNIGKASISVDTNDSKTVRVGVDSAENTTIAVHHMEHDIENLPHT